MLHSTVALEDAKREAVVKSGPLRCIDVDPEFHHVAASGEDKKLKVWRLDGLELLSERCVAIQYFDGHVSDVHEQ